MRVICISDKWKTVKGKVCDYPEYGEPYNVIREVNVNGRELYILAEYDERTGFGKKGFIPADEPEAAVDAVNEILETASPLA